MNEDENEINTARGDELADAESAATSATPDADELAKGNPRGDGLAREDAEPGSTPDPDELAEDGPRGDGLASDR